MTKDQDDIMEWAIRWNVSIYGGEVGGRGPDMTFVDNKRLAEIARSDHFWFNEAKKMAAEIVELKAETALQRKQLRNAWAKLGCRCIFDDNDVKTNEDSHCPYHGWYQLDPDNWDPLGDAQRRIKDLEEAQAIRAKRIRELEEKT